MRRLLGRVAPASALLVCVSVLLGPTSGLARPVAVPVVAPGGLLALDVGGFAGRAAVVVQQAGATAGRRDVQADPQGRVRLAYRTPVVPGRYRLLISGPSRAGSTAPAPVPTGGSGDAQVVSVTVPLVVDVPFRVGGSGVDAVGVHKGSHHSGGSGSASGSGVDSVTLSGTGVDVRAQLILAAALAALGLAATITGRRRARA